MTLFNNRNGSRKKPLPIQHHITGTLGGPVYVPRLLDRQQNKLFFFFSYDNEPSTLPQGLSEKRMPTALERTGDFSQSHFQGSNTVIPVYNPLTGVQYPGNVITTGIVPNMQKFLNWFPQPNFTNTAVSNGFYNWVSPLSNHNPSRTRGRFELIMYPMRNCVFSFVGSGGFGSDGSKCEPGISAGWNGPQTYDNTNNRFELNATYTLTPNLVNELAGGYDINNEQTGVPLSTLAGFQMASTGITFPQQYPGTNLLGMLPGFSFGDLSDGPSFSYDPRFPLHDHTYGF